MADSEKILHVLVGLPYSGKSTKAQKLKEEFGCPIVCPDHVRLAIHGNRFIASAEDYVWATCRAMVVALFMSCDQVIVDATNTTANRRKFWRSSCWKRQYYRIKTDHSVCIQRAKANNDSEILSIIDHMNRSFEPIQDDELDGIPIVHCGHPTH